MVEWWDGGVVGEEWTLRIGSVKKLHMITNYYQTLGLTSKATPADIATNYRKLSLRSHPKTAKESPEVAQQQFDALAEAYEVLSDTVKRAYYDKYGLQRLKEGLHSVGQLKGGYRYASNSDDIFDRFFRNEEEMGRVLDLKVNEQGSMLGQAFGGLNYRSKMGEENLVVRVGCTLEQLYHGTSKVVDYTRKTLNSDGRTTSLTPCGKQLNVKGGYGAKTVLQFPGQGHQTVHGTVSDLLFCIEELPHPDYTRKGDDLVYTHWLTLAEAIECGSFSIKTLDGRSVAVGVDCIVSPKLLQELPGEGMVVEASGKRGSLFIRFRVLFPTSLSVEALGELRQLLI